MLIGLLIITIIGLLILLAKRTLAAHRLPSQGETTSAEYYLMESIFTPAERSFLGVLETATPEGLAIAYKIRLADVLGIREGNGRIAAFNRINAKHIDFLLIDKSNGKPVLAIELDDASHQRTDRAARDQFVDQAITQAGLDILHITARHAYAPADIERQIRPKLRAYAPPKATTPQTAYIPPDTHAAQAVPIHIRAARTKDPHA
ncbi:Protein of unknown function (DUF2726) [Opitutaceae bacterium TAV1]|nr:Protein of unknown function (DUF2726) [Opitutaceae bacterium TAV1]